MADTFVIFGLREKRSTIAGQIVENRHELEKLQADLGIIDAALRLYGEDPGDIPTKGRVPKRSTFFGRHEITRRCREMLREKGTIRADDITVRAMIEKGLDPDLNRKMRTDFTRRILVSLHDLKKRGEVEKIGDRQKVQWRLKDMPSDD